VHRPDAARTGGGQSGGMVQRTNQEEAMYRKIIAGHDGTEGGDDALALADAIRRMTGAELTVIGVFPEGPFVDHEQTVEYARKVEAAADRVGAECDAFPEASPARGLNNAAEELGADLIVVGSRRKSAPGHVSAGHVGLQMLHGAPCAVLIAPEGVRDGDFALGEIGVAFDGSPEARLAQDAAVSLAQETGAAIRLISVLNAEASAFGWGYGVIDLEEQMREIYGERLDEAASRIPDGIKVQKELLSRGPVSDLIEEAAKRVDLLVVGSRGYGPLRRVLLGSVSAPLVKHCPSPVLVVPRGATNERTGTGSSAVAQEAR